MLSVCFLDFPRLVWYCVLLREAMKMKKMIDEIWDGDISPQDNLISDNQEYRELQHRQSQNKAELLEALSDEQKELLEKFCATEIELNGISEREAFTAGFKIAMRFAAEVFYEADNE